MRYKNTQGTCPIKPDTLIKAYFNNFPRQKFGPAGDFIWNTDAVHKMTEFEPVDIRENPIDYHDIMWVGKASGIGVETDKSCDELATELITSVLDDTFDYSNGGSTPSQYAIPNNSKDLQDLIEHKQMSFTIGNIFKAVYRIGSKNDELYEINKILWFADRRKKELMK